MHIYDLFMYPLEKILLSRIRKILIPQAFGNVLEIGYGTGVNFKYYNHNLITNISALDVEIPSLINNKGNQSINFFKGKAEDLPFENETFDTVVETLVFCSVTGLDTSIKEVIRVLKPGGLFIFIDHVLPEGKSFASLFKKINIFWPKIAGGCNLTREPHKLIEKTGFVIEQSGKSGHSVFRFGVGRKL